MSSNAARQVADRLRVIRAKAETEAPVAACAALGQAAQVQIMVTLSATTHPPGTRTPSVPGQPPSRITGRLADSIHCTTARSMGPGVARCAVGTTLVYGPVHEFGPVTIRAKNFPQLGNPAVGFFGRSVVIPRRPFIAPTVRLMESTGMARRVGTDAWNAVMDF
jgi:phage gpG-like protein